MSERESRALAAARQIEIDGKTYKLRPLSLQLLVDLEQEALRHYKREYLETFRENADLLGKDKLTVLRQEMEQVGKWQLHDLPQKTVHDVNRVPITEELRAWVESNVGEVPDTDAGIRAVLVTALDSGQLTREHVKKLAGKQPIKGLVRYDQWWITGSIQGMLSFITSSIRAEHPEITKEVVARWPFSKIAEAARLVEGITSASMGNG